MEVLCQLCLSYAKYALQLLSLLLLGEDDRRVDLDLRLGPPALVPRGLGLQDYLGRFQSHAVDGRIELLSYRLLCLRDERGLLRPYEVSELPMASSLPELAVRAVKDVAADSDYAKVLLNYVSKLLLRETLPERW